MIGKRYSLALIAGAALLFAATCAANILLDPEYVFRTGLFPKTVNWNERNGRLEQYKKEPRSVDGLLFSSSRGNVLKLEQLASSMNASHLMSVSVSYGMITDHLPIFEYIMRDKAAHGEHLKAVMLLLDADFFGKQPWTNSNINSFLPPELSNESPVRYWWRYMTVFQYRLWRNALRSAQIKPANAALPATTPVIAPPAIPEAARPPIPLVAETYRRSWNSLRPDLKRQLADLERFVWLCRSNGVKLTVAVSPMIQQNLDSHEPGMIDDLTRRLSTVTPLWDFNSPPVIAGHRKYWLDFSHFSPEAGSFILHRIFGGDLPPDFAAFGKLRGATSTN